MKQPGVNFNLNCSKRSIDVRRNKPINSTLLIVENVGSEHLQIKLTGSERGCRVRILTEVGSSEVSSEQIETAV